MKTISKIAMILSLTVLAACSTPMVTTRFDKEDLKQVATTYKLQPATLELIEDMDPLNQQRLEAAMHGALKKLGMIPAEDADMVVYYSIKVEEEQDVKYWTRYYGRWNRLAFTEVSVHEYEKGTLMVDLVDSGTQETIWQGEVSGKADAPIKKVHEKIDKAVNAIFAKYAKQSLKANS